MIRSYGGKSPRIHPTAFVSEFAYLVGDIEIGAQSSVWPGVVIRVDQGAALRIGQRTNIQDGSVVHADVDMMIGDDVTLGHSVVCHAAKVGDHCLLGNNCTLNDGVVINDWSIVAANSVVLEDTETPPRSIVAGVPGKVIGTMQDRHIERVRYNAEAYVKLAAEYKAQGNLE